VPRIPRIILVHLIFNFTLPLFISLEPLAKLQVSQEARNIQLKNYLIKRI